MPHRPRSRVALLAGAACAALSVLPGCIALVAGAGGAAGGYTLAQERSPEDTVNDMALRSEISQSWAQYNFDLAHDLDATVYEGRVLITGRVPSEEWRQEAVKRTWQVKGVKEVYDEAEVGADPGFMQDARDTMATTRLRAELVADGNVRSINYTITTVNGIVYVIGSARTQAELDRVLDYARNLANVRRVVSYVRIRPGEGGGAQPAGARPAGAQPQGMPAGDAAGATPPPAPPPPIATPEGAPTPRQSIEVTPLK